MSEDNRCPGCGQELPPHAPHGLCAECLLRLGMESQAPSSSDRADSGLTDEAGELTPAGFRPILEGPGSRIGPYRLLQAIGEGGMGVVYMAEQEKPVRRRVALKIIKPGMDTSQVIARFEAERQALALMDHQHIAKVLDAGATDTGRPYFVMELVRGVPITEYCDRNQLTPKERLELFVPVCNAIQHAHQKGIIHRDIKPSNVLVMIYDGKPVAKVIDFGVAKATDQRLTERTMFTQFGQVIGTLEYMSPEQAEMGSLDIDSRSDIYSLGVVLYELLTGSTPLERVKVRQAAYMEILRRIRDDETPKPSTRLSDSKESLAAISAQRKTEPARLARLVRGELDWIVMRALEKDRVRRYDTANAFARDIQRYLAGDPVEAGPPSAIYRFSKFARKYRPWLYTAAAFAALLLSATAVSAWQAFRATQAERSALADRNRALDAKKVAHAERNRALVAEKASREQSNRALEAELAARTERNRAEAAQQLAQSASSELIELYIEMREIGRAYYDQGDFSRARKPLTKVLEGYRRLRGDHHPDTLGAMSNLGLLLRAQGNYPEAAPLLVKAIEGYRRALGDEHPITVRAINNLAKLYKDQGAFEKAESLFRKAMELERRSLGKGDPDTPDIISNLALTLRELGQERYAEAEELLRKALELNEARYSKERYPNGHPELARTLNNLGAVLQAESEYRQALGYHQRALAMFQALYPKERYPQGHPELARTLNNLGAVSQAEAKNNQASEYYQKALEMFQALFPRERYPQGHADILDAMNNLAGAYRADGQLNRAQLLDVESLKLHKAKLGLQHPSTLITMNNLAATYLMAQRWVEAEMTARECVRLQAENQPDDWRRFRTMSQLGAALAGQKRYSEAEPLLLQGYEGLLDRDGKNALRAKTELAEAAARIVPFYESWGKPEMVAKWRAKLKMAGNIAGPKP